MQIHDTDFLIFSSSSAEVLREKFFVLWGAYWNIRKDLTTRGNEAISSKGILFMELVKGRKTLFLVLFLINVLFLSCKGSENSVATQTDNQTLHWDIRSEPDSLDPQVALGTWSAIVLRDMFVGLMADDQNANITLGLAASWAVSDDGQMYTFYLRKDAKWSDGTPITAKDFVYSFRRTTLDLKDSIGGMRNGKALSQGLMQDGENLGVRAVDDYTLQVFLETPNPLFIEKMRSKSAYPVPRHVIEKFGEDWTKPENMVSNGPYKIAEWKPNNYIKVVKNEFFYDAANVKIKEVYYYPISSRIESFEQFKEGKLDLVREFPLEKYKWLQENMPNETRVSSYLGIYYYAMNLNLPKFQDIKVRKALSMLVNREFLTENIAIAGEIPAYSFATPLENYTPAQLSFVSLSPKERLEEAKKLLQEAGYSSAKPLTIKLRHNTSKDHKKVAMAVAKMWKDVGVEVEVSDLPTSKHYAEIRKGNFEIARAGWIINFPDASNFLQNFLPNSRSNYGGYNNPQYQQRMRQVAEVIKPEVRAKIMQEAEQIMLDDYATIPLYYYVSRNLVSQHVKGWFPNSADIHPTRYMYKE